VDFWDCWSRTLYKPAALLDIGVGDGRHAAHKNLGKYFSDNYYVIFGHFSAKIM